jgi:hypothetical protein
LNWIPVPQRGTIFVISFLWRADMRIPLLVLLSALCAACASQPATPVAPATASAKPAAPAAPATAEAKDKGATKDKAPPGYKAKTRNGETVYCKKVAQIGSRFETETCVTASEAEQMEHQAEWERALLRKNTACTGACGGGG